MASGKEWNTLLKDLMPSWCENHIRYVVRVSTVQGNIWQIGSERDEDSRWKFVGSSDSAIEATKQGFSYTDSSTHKTKYVSGGARAIAWSDVRYILMEADYFHNQYAFRPLSRDAALPENLRSGRFKSLVERKKLKYTESDGGKLESGVQFRSVSFGDDPIHKSDGLFDFTICNDLFLCLTNRKDRVVLIGAWDQVVVMDVS